MQNLPEIEKVWKEYKSKRIKQFPQNNLRASSVGNTCKRYHYMSIKNWREKPIHDYMLQSIFDEGNYHETLVIQELQNMGFEIMHQQRPIQIDKPLITGHIDGILRHNEIDYPFDVKTMSPWAFDSVNSAEDLMFSKKVYQRQYPAQLQLYLLMSGNEHGCFIMKNKVTGELKAIWMQIDYDYLEPILKRAEAVYEDLKNETPSDRCNDFDLCNNCDFRHICLPDIKNDPNVFVMDDMELAGMLDRREELKENRDEFEKIDKIIKGQAVIGGFGDKLCGDYMLKVQEFIRKTKVPIDFTIKETPYFRTKIIKLEV